jgi:hypothetical protein
LRKLNKLSLASIESATAQALNCQEAYGGWGSPDRLIRTQYEDNSMSEILKKTVAYLPELLPRNAKSMMQRIVDATQTAIAADPRFGASSYSALLLKMSSDALVREFDLAIRATMSGMQKQAGVPGVSVQWLGLSIEPLEPGGGPPDADFLTSTALFETLCAKAGDLGVDGFGACSKAVFLASFNDAFTNSHIDPDEARKIVPFARQALNGELVKLYAKLDSLCFGDTRKT